jgi:hypothetical protein
VAGVGGLGRMRACERWCGVNRRQSSFGRGTGRITIINAVNMPPFWENPGEFYCVLGLDTMTTRLDICILHGVVRFLLSIFFLLESSAASSLVAIFGGTRR